MKIALSVSADFALPAVVGLSLGADNITITGLSIYGFQVGSGTATQNIPAADIFIATSNYPQLDGRSAPRNIVIENNWLGIRSDRSIPARGSDFGKRSRYLIERDLKIDGVGLAQHLFFLSLSFISWLTLQFMYFKF